MRFRRDVRGLILLGMITTLAASLTAGVQARADDQPPPLYSSALAYDQARGRVVLFGGYLAGQYSGDTWEWDGAHWARVSRSGPSPRNGPAVAYDSLRQRVVLFGGDHGALAFGDTWTWDGTAWTLVASNGPPARSLHRMVYDSWRQRVVLFGGRTNTTMFGDTWTWDGANWAKVDSTGPAPRFLHAFAWDTGRGRGVLFGGNRALGPSTDADLYLDTWEWDGTRWDSVAASGPPARDHTALGFDPVRRRAVLFGGSGPEAAGFLGDTWEWSGATWEHVTDSGPGPRAGGMLVYTPQSAILLYGGFAQQGPSTELWSWNGGDWRRVLPVAVETAPWSRIKRRYR